MQQYKLIKLLKMNTCSGTFLNCVQIPKGKNNFVILKHGDLIAFGDKGKSEFIYKFSLSSNVEKRPRIDNFIKKEGTVPEVIKLDDTNYKKFLTKLDSKILILKVEYLAFSNKTKMQISEFLILLNVALEWANKLNTEIMKHKYFIQEFNKNTTEEFHSTLILSQDNKNTQEPPKELMKIQVNNVLENIPLDSVYKEVMSKVQESNFKIDKESPTSFSDELTDFFSSSENAKDLLKNQRPPNYHYPMTPLHIDRLGPQW
ncbi:Hypothetical protein CINCED_3A009381 [Cinara cedri]|uniref:FHA domain-containing protein n=1 Tax=Cinara cedri TaxID=506608 RepID=A0A5E4M9W0_9HEMI|nr:Hypothetical protein CINCED_3A009381 [Cinara cedri]